MTNLVQLFIGDREVEFSVPLDVLYTYQVSELENPTVVKNSFSKTITIEGTPTNNQIFGHYWSVERLQDYSTEGSGIYFNASRKIPFVIYVDSIIYEQGYAKLDNVNTFDGHINYNITLYGGLGDFFYKLKATDDGQQKKLSDLNFGTDLDFTINAATVMEAWVNLKGYDEWANAVNSFLYPEIQKNDKWHTLNFMPAYNGLPDNFNADKVVIDTTDTYLITYATEEGKTYTSKEGYIMGELSEELTEWEVRDLRSYLQRPCIRMKKIIEACCNPENNGGYNVELDSDFFNEDNPYWEDTWLSLPMISNIEYKTEEQIVEDSELIVGNFTDESAEDSYMYQDLHFNLGNFPNQTVSSLRVECNIRNTSYGRPYTSFINFSDTTYKYNYKGRCCYGSLYVQLLAFNGETVIGASEAYNLTSPIRVGGHLYYGDNSNYEKPFEPYGNNSIYTALGSWQGGRWCYEGTSTPYNFLFTIYNLNSPITSLKLCYYWGYSKDKKNLVGINKMFDKLYQVGKNYSIQPTTTLMEQLEFVYVSTDLKAIMGDSMGRTGTRITKELLLNTESSPCDYLLSYAKMFGLYFRKDVENNTIYIETRKTFYNRSEIVDLSDYIDKGKEISLKPLSFDTKWYEFKQPSDKTDFSERYMSTKGVDYGSKIINTGYEFIADRKNLLEGNIIKSGIEGLERSRWFSTTGVFDKNYRPFYNNMTYNLYDGNNTLEMKNDGSKTTFSFITITLNQNVFGINENAGMKYYDVFPKLQFHDNKNSPSDGNNVLVFFSGFKGIKNGRITPLHYNLSDDNKYQTIFNDGEPCWLITNAEIIDNRRIAYVLDDIPCFERYKTDEGSTKVNYSLDFGTAQELYVPNYSITDTSNIYSRYWDSYIKDLYDVNTRILTCYVKVQGRPNPEWLRRFYWFDNALWRLNNIIDWNISSFDTTKMEFVKVQDLKNYTNIGIAPLPTFKILYDTAQISASGGRVVVNVSTSDGGNWRVLNPLNDNLNQDENYVVLSRSTGSGNGSFEVSVSSNNGESGRPIYLTVTNEIGQTAFVNLYQSSTNETYFNVNPDNLIISGEETQTLVGFNWTNKKTNVDNYLDEGDVDVASVEFNQGLANAATIYFNPNTDKYVKSEKITFTSGVYSDVLGVDQLPTILEFDKEGKTTFTLSFKYSKPNFTELPYWINLIKISDYEYRCVAKPNYYEQPNEDHFKVNGVEVKVVQEKGDGLNNGDSYVNPNNFYIGKEGGSQFMLVNIPNDWRITNNVSWITLSQTNGMGNSIVSLTVKENTDVSRSTTIIVTDTKKGIQFPVTVYQEGSITNPTFNINPSSTTVSKEGGVVRATFTYTDRGSDYLSVNTELSTGNVIWNGVDGYMDITVPFNDTVEQRTFEVIFTNQLGNFIFTIVQEKGDSTLSTSEKSVAVSFEGGVVYNNIISNTSWTVINDADWFTISPLSGNGNQTIEITVQPNTVQTDRESVVNLFTVDNKTASFKVSQRQFIPQLTVTPSSLTFDADGGSQTIKIISNTDWNIIL